MLSLGRLRRFVRAKTGLAAVEFALLAPLMVFLLFGSVDLIDALSVDRRVQNVAASLADVVARDTEVSNDEITGLWAAAGLLMFPSDGSTIDVRITSISIINPTTAKVVWSEGRNGYAPLAVNTTMPLPAAMMTPGSSLILAESRYNYVPPLGFLFGSGIAMTHSSYRRSRVVDPIPRVA